MPAPAWEAAENRLQGRWTIFNSLQQITDMAYPDLRAFLADVEGDILPIDEALDPRFEMAALLHETQADGRILLFNSVKGYPGVRVMGNLLASRARTAKALATTEALLNETYLSCKARAMAPVLAQGPVPVKEVVHTAPQDLLDILPVLTYHEKDVAPFITCGLVMAKDPATGRRAMGIHRLMYQGGNRLGIFLANPPLSHYFKQQEERGQPLQISIALGVEPATLIAAVVKVGENGPDKLEVAGGLRGFPLELAPAESVDMDVLARAEVVIEGRVLPGERAKEGPFGENTGYYFTNESPVVEVTAITHRKDFIYAALCPWTVDVDNLLSLASGAELLGQLQKQIHGVLDLELITGTCGFTGVIAVRNLPAGDVRRLIQLVLSLDMRLKIVTVVDEDVDIRNPREVAWALATRFQPDRDTVLLQGLTGYVIDPSAVAAGSGSKIGFDATRGPQTQFDGIRFPQAALARAREILGKVQG